MAAGAWTTKTVLDSDGNELTLRAWDEAGDGSGPFYFGHVEAEVEKISFVDVTFTLDTSAYTAGDVLADTQVITGACKFTDGFAKLESLALIDEDDQGVAMDLHFFSANRSLGTENGAPNISDANARDWLGSVAIASGDWKDLGGVKVARISAIGLILKPASATKDVYVGIVNGAGTPTFTASGLKGRFAFTPG